MPTQTTMPPTGIGGRNHTKITTYHCTIFVISNSLGHNLSIGTTVWYLHDKYYLICNPWKYPQSFPMSSALSAILYLFLGGSLWLEYKRRWIRRSSMEQDMWLAVASTWQFDPISEQSCDWLNNLGHSNMEVLVGFLLGLRWCFWSFRELRLM